MQPSEAIALIQHPLLSHSTEQVWADLGCGTGTFTLALAALLAPPGLIYALDKDKIALNKIPNHYNDINIKKHIGDFMEDDLHFDSLDGILMANALHYVNNKVKLINKLSTHLKESGSFLIIEYETDRANPWVPYPIRFQALKQLFMDIGFSSVEKLREMPSRYQGKMYAALIR